MRMYNPENGPSKDRADAKLIIRCESDDFNRSCTFRNFYGIECRMFDICGSASPRATEIRLVDKKVCSNDGAPADWRFGSSPSVAPEAVESVIVDL